MPEPESAVVLACQILHEASKRHRAAPPGSAIRREPVAMGHLRADASGRRLGTSYAPWHSCKACGGRFKLCHGAYGTRDGHGTWTQGPSAGLDKSPESPNESWCCQVHRFGGPS